MARGKGKKVALTNVQRQKKCRDEKRTENKEEFWQKSRESSEMNQEAKTEEQKLERRIQDREQRKSKRSGKKAYEMEKNIKEKQMQVTIVPTDRTLNLLNMMITLRSLRTLTFRLDWSRRKLK